MGAKFVGKNQDTNIIKVDTIAKAYTLGFLWGDGNLQHYQNSDIYYPRLEINNKDLQSIMPLFNKWGKWSCSVRKRENRKEVGMITLCDKELGWFLKTKDYDIKSSVEPTKILSIIPENLQPYWWRGFVDADGCFYQHDGEYLRQFSLAGSYEQEWKEAKKLFRKLGIKKSKAVSRQQITNSGKNKSSIVRITNKEDIVKFGDYIYSDHLSIGLRRKYNKYLLIKQS